MIPPELTRTLGPLAALYADPEVLEIMVDGPDRVLVERHGRLEDAGVRFDSPQTLQAMIDSTLKLGGILLGPGQTIGDVRLPGGVARMLVVLPPTAPAGPTLAIRKLIVPSLSWEKLLEFRAISQPVLDLLLGAIHARKSILVSGGTGSGKTTVLDLLAESIPAEERLVVAEEVHEIQIRRPRAVFLEAATPARVPMADLLSAAARMRPDWLIIGELCGPEALRAVEILGRGHNGMTTIHAESVENALARLEMLCLMANVGLGLAEIRSLIASALPVISYQQRLASGNRRITQIVELCGLEHDRYVLQPLARYSPETDTVEVTGAQPSWA
jgi:pilus assembly protein CpaF